MAENPDDGPITLAGDINVVAIVQEARRRLN